MKREQVYLSTIDPEAARLAAQWDLGLEIAEYCTASNMDADFPRMDREVRGKLALAGRCVFHGPFNELFPCAIDPKARELADYRYRQAAALAGTYGAARMVLHGGFTPAMYYPCWYTEQSVIFWREFLQRDPGIEICLENVMEPEPEMLAGIVEQVQDPRLGICLDIGHCNVYSQISVEQWLERLAPHIRHFHIHNNQGDADTHSPLDCGSIPMGRLLERVEALCPQASITLELPEAESSVRWLREQGILK